MSSAAADALVTQRLTADSVAEPDKSGPHRLTDQGGSPGSDPP